MSATSERLIELASKEWVWMLYILAPATGMRIAELLAVEIDKHISPDCTMIVVRQQVKGSKIVKYLKTDAAYRVVDLCPEAAALLRKFIGAGEDCCSRLRRARRPFRTTIS